MEVLRFIISAGFRSNVGCNAEKFDRDVWAKHINPIALACAMQYLSEKGYNYEKSKELICDELEACWGSHKEGIRQKKTKKVV